MRRRSFTYEGNIIWDAFEGILLRGSQAYDWADNSPPSHSLLRRVMMCERGIQKRGEF